jgi:hypothetical protein
MGNRDPKRLKIIFLFYFNKFPHEQINYLKVCQNQKNRNHKVHIFKIIARSEIGARINNNGVNLTDDNVNILLSHLP